MVQHTNNEDQLIGKVVPLLQKKSSWYNDLSRCGAIINDSMDALEEVLQSMNDVCFGVGLSIILQLKETKILAIPPSISLTVLLQFVYLNPNEEPVELESFNHLAQ